METASQNLSSDLIGMHKVENGKYSNDFVTFWNFKDFCKTFDFSE